MIEQILKPFDFITAMSITDQCQFFVGLSFAGFCFAAVLREACKDHHIRYVARALGAAAFFAVASFAMHATHQVEQLERELFVKEGKKISAEHAVTLTSKKGNTIQIGETNGLRRIASELRQHDGSIRPSRGISGASGSRFAAGSVGGNGSDGCRYDGVVDARRMLKQSGWWSANNAASIQQSGKAEGTDF